MSAPRRARVGEAADRGDDTEEIGEGVYEVLDIDRTENTARIQRRTDGQVYIIPLGDLESCFEVLPN